jgi:hypothetical protein
MHEFAHHVPAMVTPDPWHDFGVSCPGSFPRYDHGLDERKWTIWLHARKPYDLGWLDSSVSPDDNYCDIADTRFQRSEYEEVACGRRTGALSAFNRGTFFIECFRFNGGWSNRLGAYCVPYCFFCLEAFAALLPNPND